MQSDSAERDLINSPQSGATSCTDQSEWPNVVLVLGEPERVLAILLGLLPSNGKESYKIVCRNGVGLAIRNEGVILPQQWSPSADEEAIVLGHLVHEAFPPEQAIPEAVANLSSGMVSALAKLQGIFVLIRIDWRAGRVQLVSDLLGTKPFYTCDCNGIVVLSDRATTCARWNGGRIDPLGFSAYLILKTALADRSMYEGVARVPGSTVLSVSTKEYRTERYWHPSGDDLPIGPDDLADQFHHEFRKSVARLLAPHTKATILLSGGFDSRYILLCGLELDRPDLDCATVAYNEAEDMIARQVARDLGVGCRSVSIPGSLWDRFPDLWHHHPDGYPISRNLTYLAVISSEFTGPYVDGSLAGMAFRCPAVEPVGTPPRNAGDAYEEIWGRRLPAPELIFRPAIVRRHFAAAQQAIREQGEQVGWQPKFRLLWSYHTHERRYISNNLLQYQSIATSVHPFYDRSLLERRLRYTDAAFSREAYRALLQRHYPWPGGHPHADDSAHLNDTIRAFCWKLWRQIPALTMFIARHRAIFRTNWIVPRLSAYAFGNRSQLYVVMTLARLYELERLIGPDATEDALAGRKL
jgi:hypothetical protein